LTGSWFIPGLEDIEILYFFSRRARREKDRKIGMLEYWEPNCLPHPSIIPLFHFFACLNSAVSALSAVHFFS
jgi:hypothetical protein